MYSFQYLIEMGAPLLVRGLPFLRLHLRHFHQYHRPSFLTHDRAFCSAAAVNSSPSTNLSFKDHPDHCSWKDEQAQIRQDVDPIISLTKDILHSHRYKDGEHLTVEDEKAVIDKLLVHHPHSEDKIGCGLDSIMVDRHPQFKHSRCLFVVRTDGGWIDFSYKKCLSAYIQDKYPSHAEKFNKEHLKSGSD